MYSGKRRHSDGSVVSLRLGQSGVSVLASKFNKGVEEHQKKQQLNPFSTSHKLDICRYTKSDLEYGRPQKGSESEKRAEEARHHVMKEIKYLCDMIWECAQWRSEDGRAAISFEKLFKLYNAISDKVVGTLLRARKHGYVLFEGEMLYQRRDNDKVIELARSINTIRASFQAPSNIFRGGDVQPWDEPIPQRRFTFTTVNNNRQNISRRASTPEKSLFISLKDNRSHFERLHQEMDSGDRKDSLGEDDVFFDSFERSDIKTELKTIPEMSSVQ